MLPIYFEIEYKLLCFMPFHHLLVSLTWVGDQSSHCSLYFRILSGQSQVKVWCTKQESSVFNIDMKANICCVKYNPGSSIHVAVIYYINSHFLIACSLLVEPFTGSCWIFFLLFERERKRKRCRWVWGKCFLRLYCPNCLDFLTQFLWGSSTA